MSPNQPGGQANALPRSLQPRIFVGGVTHIRVLVNIAHPAHVHFFKHFIWEMENRGHEIRIAAIRKDVALNLLQTYGFDYTLLPVRQKKGFDVIAEQLKYDYHLYTIAQEFKPDIITGIGGVAPAHISRITGAKSIVFTDTEHSVLSNSITFPFADIICTPTCYRDDIGKKQIRYDGYHELAYLHPNYFQPDPGILHKIGLDEHDDFFVLRFVSWNAVHDRGQHGIENRDELITILKDHGQVLITSESKLPKAFNQYMISVPPEKIHDLLYYAKMYIGEGSTMASESAILGTHALLVNTLNLGYTSDEEEKYDLVYNFYNFNNIQEQAIQKVTELLENTNLKQEGKRKREQLLKDKIDVTQFMIDFFEQNG